MDATVMPLTVPPPHPDDRSSGQDATPPPDVVPVAPPRR